MGTMWVVFGLCILILTGAGAYYAGSFNKGTVSIRQRIDEVEERCESAFRNAERARTDAETASEHARSAKGTAANGLRRANEAADEVAAARRAIQRLEQAIEDGAIGESEETGLGELLPLLLSGQLGALTGGQSGGHQSGEPDPYHDEPTETRSTSVRGFPSKAGQSVRTTGGRATRNNGAGQPTGDGSDRRGQIPIEFRPSSTGSDSEDGQRGSNIDESV